MDFKETMSKKTHFRLWISDRTCVFSAAIVPDVGKGRMFTKATAAV